MLYGITLNSLTHSIIENFISNMFSFSERFSFYSPNDDLYNKHLVIIKNNICFLNDYFLTQNEKVTLNNYFNEYFDIINSYDTYKTKEDFIDTLNNQTNTIIKALKRFLNT